MKHPCHADRCSTEISPRMLMCRIHWARVPKKLQDELWAAYVPGQERRKDPTEEYLVVQERCVCAVSVKEGHITQEEADARIAARQGSASFIAEVLPLIYSDSTPSRTW